MDRPVITLMTDFGQDDIFVGVMKGVMAGIVPEAVVVDLTHAIPPFGIAQAAYQLGAAYPYFPKGTVHIAVVDPGVGSERRILAMESDGHLFVAPDNGILTVVHDEKGHGALVAVTERRFFLPEISATFHGRDIFAPVGAHLARGAPLRNLGPAVDDMQRLDLPEPWLLSDGSLQGVVLWVDRFGNLITNISRAELQEYFPRGPVAIRLRRTVIHGLSQVYTNVAEGELVAMIGSFGTLEIAVRLGNAAERLGVGRGDDVLVSAL